MSDELIIRQCAPTLAGIKTGSLFPCRYESLSQLMDDVRNLNRRLVSKGLSVLPMRCENGSALLYVYRPRRLQKDLSGELAQKLLQEAGYPCGGRRSSLTKWVCSSAIRRRTWQASSPITPVAANAPASGKSTATRRAPSGCFMPSKPARQTTAAICAPARRWRSLWWLSE